MSSVLQGIEVFLVVAAIVFAALAYLWFEFITRPHRDDFKGKGIHAWLDYATRQVIFELADKAVPLRVPFGSLETDIQVDVDKKSSKVWHSGTSGSVNLYTSNTGWTSGTVKAGTPGEWITVYEEVRTGLSSVRILTLKMPEYFRQRWATHERSGPYVSTISDSVDFQLPNRTAKALQRWLRAHRTLLLSDEAGHRKEWDKACDALLAKCRQQRGHVDLKRVIEAYKFTAKPEIRYLRIEPTGAIFTATGADPVVIPLSSDTPVKASNATLEVIMVPWEKVSFQLSKAQVSSLHQIQRAGALSLA